MEEYISLRQSEREFRRYKNEVLKPQEEEWKKKKKALKAQIKNLKGEQSKLEIRDLQEQLEAEEQKIKERLASYDHEREVSYTIPYSHFRVLTKGPQTQEVLYGVELVIHVQSDEQTMRDILNHQYDLTSIGRSEDFIELQEMKLVELKEQVDHEVSLPDGYAILVRVDQFENENYYFFGNEKKANAQGTVYYVAKNYTVENGKRTFDRIPCLYSSHIRIDQDSSGVLWDEEGNYIVSLN